MRRLWRRAARAGATSPPSPPDAARLAPAAEPDDAGRRPARRDDGLRFFFVHVMKTGGMSLFQQFRANFPLDELYPTRDLDIRYDGKFRHLELPYLLGIAPERRARLRLYAGHFPYVACEMLGGGFTTMTLLRDPVERTISMLHQLQRNVDWIGPNHDGAEPPPMRTLEDIYADPTVFDALIHDHQTKIFSMTLADQPQSYRQAIHVDASRLALAKENLANVDVVGLMDGYDDFLDELADKFGWTVRHDVRSNEAPAGAAPEPVSDALRARMVDDNAIDLEFYEFAEALVADRRHRAEPAAADVDPRGSLTVASAADRGRYFFVHVMKTGGMTLVEQIRQNFSPDEVFPQREFDLRFVEGRLHVRHHLDLDYLAGLSQERRDRVRFYSGHFPYVACEAVGSDVFTMTILREPVARTVSLLRQRIRNPMWVPRGEPSRMDSHTVEEAYTNPEVFAPLVHDHQTKIFSMSRADGIHTYLDVVDVDRARLEQAKANLAKVDVIGLTEDYDAFLGEVSRRFGWSLRRDVRLNTTPDAGAREPVSDSLRARIAEDNAIDVEFYEYAVELVRLRRGRRPVDA